MKKTIELEEYNKLKDIELKMSYLESGGVDNWEFYSDSLQKYWEIKELEDTIKDTLSEITCSLFEGVYEPSERGAGYSTTDDCMEMAYSILMKFVTEIKQGK